MLIKLIITLCVLIGVLCVFMLYRIRKVSRFRAELIAMIYNTERGLIDRFDNPLPMYQRLNDLYNRYSFDDMLYSSRPLRLEAWYTEEEIKDMKGE